MLINLCVWNLKIGAQELFTPPQSQFITRMPFTLLSGGVVIIKATLNDFPDTLNFILDTGSGGISLDSVTVQDLKLPVTPSARTIRGIAGIRRISFVINQSLHLPGITVEKLDFHINDYEILTSVYGFRIDGIIGYSFFKRYIVKVNYDLGMLEVWTQGEIKYPRNGHLLKPKINNLPVIEARVRDENTSTTKYFFDTGAGLCFLFTEEYLKDSAILKKGKKIIETQGEGLGGKKLMRLTTVKEVKLGPYKFRNVPAHIFEDEFNLTSYPELGGLIGNDLLRRFNIIMNYEKSEFHLLPNTHFNDAFDYSYSGLSIYLVDGNVVVEDVMKNSPGEKAGLLTGDIIIGINTNLSGSMQVYKTILQTPGRKIKILIMREGVPFVKYLKVVSIL